MYVYKFGIRINKEIKLGMSVFFKANNSLSFKTTYVW